MWKLNDATGKFEELTAFTDLMEGTTNEYIWRMGSHNDKLYVATMDAGIFYNYLTQLTNGSFFKMTPAERLAKLTYINKVIQLLAMAKGNEIADELRSKLEQLQQLLSQYVETEQIDEDTTRTLIDIQGLTQEIRNLVTSFVQQQAASVAAILVPLIENARAQGQEQLNAIISTLEYLSSEQARQQWAQLREQLQQATPEELREMLNSAVQTTLTTLGGQIQSVVSDIYDRIDGKGIEMYLYINNAVKNNEWGFDLLRTADGGQSFEVITRNGFDDKYNYGCPSFLSTEEGLYFGTCNPFYGGQLFLLSEEGDTPAGISLPSVTNNLPSTLNAQRYYTLDGRVINGKPVSQGVYIKDGRKVVVSE